MNTRASLSSRLFMSGWITAALLLVASVGQAHHSYSMFDRQVIRSYAAVVSKWEFVSPHAYLWVYINDDKGTPQLWGLEGPGPQALLRAGWDKNTVKPGEKVTVEINPLRDGRNGGNLISMTLNDGRKMQAGALPGAAGGQAILNDGPDAVEAK
jgi:hypothetical protein